MAEVTFAVAGAALGVLVAANAALILARMTHHEKFARQIVKVASRYTWLFKLGGDGDSRRNRRMNGSIRA